MQVVGLLAGNVYAVVNSSNQGDVLTWANAKIQLILSTPNSDQPKTAVTKIGGKIHGNSHVKFSRSLK